MGSKVLCTLSSPLCCMIRAEERNPVNEIQNPDEIQIDTKLFKSWRKKSGYRYLGKTYTNTWLRKSTGRPSRWLSSGEFRLTLYDHSFGMSLVY
jgi:hypothetical protein